MKFDDHEIWGAPAHPAESAAPVAAPVVASVPTAVAAGTLYRSAGSEAHPDAIVALPSHHRHHTAVHPVEATSWAETGLHAPISINSLLPPRTATPPAPRNPSAAAQRAVTPATPLRSAPIDDPAIAEVLGAAVVGKSAPPTGFTSWFREATGFAPEPAGAPAETGRTRSDRPATDPRAPKQRSLPHLTMAGPVLSVRGAALLAFAFTTVVAIVNAKLSTSLGAPTGVSLVLASIAIAWLMDPSARRAAWVLPPYVLVAALLVADQFTANAPGASIIGQAILVVAGLITLAPWLALSSALGVVVPALRRSGH